MNGPDRERMRMLFDDDAERYDRARPGYPPSVFEDLAALPCFAVGRRILEIGPGTGQVTLPLARRGCRIVAIELGEQMASVARRRLARFENVRIEIAAFESWPLEAEPFDALVAASSLHWVDPAVRMHKAADALRMGGVLAVLRNRDITGEDGGFFERSQELYRRFTPSTSFRPPSGLEPPEELADIDASGRFGALEVRRYLRERSYTSREYVELLLTYSDVLALPDPDRRGLVEGIAELIESSFGGRVRRFQQTVLCLARRSR